MLGAHGVLGAGFQPSLILRRSVLTAVAVRRTHFADEKNGGWPWPPQLARSSRMVCLFPGMQILWDLH